MASCTGEEHRVLNESLPFSLDEIENPGWAHPMPVLVDLSGMSIVRRKKWALEKNNLSRHNSATKKHVNGGKGTIKFLIDAHMGGDNGTGDSAL